MSTDLFIQRPVMTTLLMAGILVFGIMAYRLLPVSDLPNIDFPTIQVTASLPGANPDTMASAVATPLEKQFSTIAGIDSMTSTSALGTTQITMQFTLERNIDAAAQDVQAAIAAAQNQMPPGMPTPPSYKKVNPADQPILYLAVSSPTLPLYVVDEYAQTNLAQRISTINGVAQVGIFGSQKYAVRVQLDPSKMATLGIGIDEVQKALADSNVNLPTGTLWGPNQAFSVQATGQLTTAAAYRPMIVAYRNGSPVRLEQIGRVIDGVQSDKVASWYNDERAVVLADPEAARHQHHRDRGLDQSGAAGGAGAAARLGEPQHPLRPVGLDPRVGPRRPVHADAGHRAGGARHLPLLAERLGHGHPQPRAPDVDRGHVHGHVRARLHHRQPLPHGADPGRRLHRGRRHRHAREHRAPHGGGDAADGGRPRGRSGDRLHHRLHDRVAGRGVPARAVHGWHRGPPAPRVRGRYRRRGDRVRHRLADPDADGVQPLPSAAARIARPRVRGFRARLHLRCSGSTSVPSRSCSGIPASR